MWWIVSGRRRREAGYVGISGGVSGDPFSTVDAASAQVRAVDQGARRADFGDEGIDVLPSAEARLERGLYRKIHRAREARYVGVARRIEGNVVRLVDTASTEVAAVDQRRAVRRELQDEAVDALVRNPAGELGLKRVDDGKVAQCREAHDDGRSRGIDGYAISSIHLQAFSAGFAANEGGVFDSGAVGEKLRDERILLAAELRVEGSVDRKVRRLRPPSKVGAARSVGRDVQRDVARRSPDAGRIDQDGVDDQRKARIKSTDVDTEGASGVGQEGGCDLASAGRKILVTQGRVKGDGSRLRFQMQATVVRDLG